MGREFFAIVVGSSWVLLLLDSVQAALKGPSQGPVWESLSLVIHIQYNLRVTDSTVTENSVNRTPRSSKYLVSIIKISIKWERVIKFSSVTQSFRFNISQLMLRSDHSFTFFMKNVQNSIIS